MTWDVAPSQDEVTQAFGCTDYSGEWPVPTSLCASGHYHAGIDLGYSGGGDATCGRPVYATRSGVVVAVGANGQGNSGFSQYLGPNAVCVRYDDGVFVEHGHLSAAHVTVGQRVSPGTHIGDIGTLGASSACHLHVEARVDGPYQGVANNAANVRDPRPYLNKLPAPAPAPAPEEDEMLAAYYRSSDQSQHCFQVNAQNLWHKVYQPSTGWKNEQIATGPLNNDGPVVIEMNAQLHVFVTGSDGYVRHAYQPDTATMGQWTVERLP